MITFESEELPFTKEIERNREEYETNLSHCKELFVILKFLLENFEDNNLLKDLMVKLKGTIETLGLTDNITINIEKKGEVLKNAIYQMQIDVLLKQFNLSDSYNKGKEKITKKFLETNTDVRIKYASSMDVIIYYEKKLKECQNQLTKFDQLKEEFKQKIPDKNIKFIEKFRDLVKKGHISDKESRQNVHRIISMAKQSPPLLSSSHRNLALNKNKSQLALSTTVSDDISEEAKLLRILEASINRVEAIRGVEHETVKCFKTYKKSILTIFKNGKMNTPNTQRELYIPLMTKLTDNLDGKENETMIKKEFDKMHFDAWNFNIEEKNFERDPKDLKRTRRLTSVNPKNRSLSPKK